MSEAIFYRGLVVGWLIFAGATFVGLFVRPAPYGRHARARFGPMLTARAGWLLMEAPAALGIAGCFFAFPGGRSPAALALLGLWEIHYLYRAFVYPFRLRGRPMPLAIALSGLGFNAVNGYLNGRALTGLGPNYSPSWLADPRFVTGAALFLIGLAVNLHSDEILLRLRAAGGGGYQVPRGGLYRWVSCPNYLGEIIEWSGWAIAAGSLAGLSFALWTAANLVPRALAHHHWYREHFADYPAERRALVPFLL